MNTAIKVLGILGLVVVAAAVAGRFYQQATVTFPLIGQHTAGAVLTFGNTLLMAAIWLGILQILNGHEKKP